MSELAEINRKVDNIIDGKRQQAEKEKAEAKRREREEFLARPWSDLSADEKVRYTELKYGSGGEAA